MIALTDIQTLRIYLWGLAIACVMAFVLSHVIGGRRQKKLERKLSDQYPLIYRIKSIPADSQCVLKAEGASIEEGDYGWEAEPLHKDGLIYLHGLNDRWQVVWYAGFKPDQLEITGPKPRTQYYVFPYWVNEEKIPPCPYPVKRYQHGKYPIAHLGFPVQVRNDWVQGKRLSEPLKTG